MRSASNPGEPLTMTRHVPSSLSTPVHVFVADDDDDLRSLVADALRADGYSVVEVHDGVELLARIADYTGLDAAVIVADVRMPHLSGLGVLSQLKKLHSKLPVVLMTGFVPDAVRVLAERLGALGVLAKPFDVDDLRTAVMNASRAS
jgi:DNA-binding NtrC family response regulator